MFRRQVDTIWQHSGVGAVRPPLAHMLTSGFGLLLVCRVGSGSFDPELGIVAVFFLWRFSPHGVGRRYYARFSLACVVAANWQRAIILHRAQHMLIGVRGPIIQEYYNVLYFLNLRALATLFESFMDSRRSGRYLKPFLEPVAPFSQSMSPFRAMATPIVTKVMHF